MNYETVVREALATFECAPSLAQLLNRIDALNKSVPSLFELNEAFAGLARSNDPPLYDLNFVTQGSYSKAVAENQEWLARTLEERGFTRAQQEAVFRWSASLWPKREA